MRKLKALAVIAASPLLDLIGLVRARVARRASLRYYAVSAEYPGYLHHGEAAAFCRYHAKRYCLGAGIDVGAGRWPFPGAHAVEDGPEENAYRLKATDASQDYVFSSHCLEHLERWSDALLEWRRVLKPGGILYLYLPHPACRMWNTEILHHHVWQPEPDALPAHLESIGFEILESSLFPDAYLSFFVVARRRG
ncbi:MAG: methyltransferase domain-containing protein [Rhodospirillaceae bacterium]